jgi:hypothetical protein
MTWGPSVIPSVSLGLKPYVVPCLSLVLVTFFDSFCESRFETFCDSLFECHPSVSLVLKPSVIPSVSLGLKPLVIPCLSLALKRYVIPC